MFSIATPQTVSLTQTPWVDPALPPVAVDPANPPKPPEVAGTVSFDHPSDDTSECRMTVTLGDKTFTHTFKVNGPCAAWTYEDDEIRKAKEAAAQKIADEKNAAKVDKDPPPAPVKGETYGQEVKAYEGQNYAPVEAGEDQPA